MKKKWEVAIFAGGDSIIVITRDDNLQEAIGRALWQAYDDADIFPDRVPIPQEIEISWDLGDEDDEIINMWDCDTTDFDLDFAIIWLQHRENEPVGYIRRIG